MLFQIKHYMGKKDYQNFKFKINMKSILLYEEMSRKSFYEVKSEDIILLIYCVLIVNNDMNITYDIFKNVMKNEKIARELISKCQTELDFIQQLTNKEEGGGNSEGINRKISEIVYMVMLQNNLDINYVMYDMRLWELEPLIKTIEEKTKNDLVEKRFWSYLNICPHIDSKKIKGPEDLIPFPWEKESKKEKAMKFMDEKKDAINKFFNKHKNTE